MNSAYVYGSVLTLQKQAGVPQQGALKAAEKQRLNRHILCDDGDIRLSCPAEIGITDRREAEPSKLGFLSLCHYQLKMYRCPENALRNTTGM